MSQRFCVSVRDSEFMSDRASEAPSVDNLMLVARPIPLPAPVTSMTLPVKVAAIIAREARQILRVSLDEASITMSLVRYKSNKEIRKYKVELLRRSRYIAAWRIESGIAQDTMIGAVPTTDN